MPDHAKQVGVLCQHVIDLLGLTMKEGQSILLGESNIAHMVSNHPADYALYGEYIPLILSAPDYVALNAKDSSIEYVKEVQVNSRQGGCPCFGSWAALCPVSLPPEHEPCSKLHRKRHIETILNDLTRIDIFSCSGIIDLQREPEGRTGSCRPLLGDAGNVTPPDSRTERGRCRDAAAFCYHYGASQTHPTGKEAALYENRESWRKLSVPGLRQVHV